MVDFRHLLQAVVALTDDPTDYPHPWDPVFGGVMDNRQYPFLARLGRRCVWEVVKNVALE
jgi:hypothetical protein